MRFAEREGEVHAVHEGQIWPRRLRFHCGDLRIAEFVSLEVSQRIPGIAMVGLGCEGCAVAFDRFIGAARGLERMATAGERGGIGREFFQHFVE